MEMSKEGMEEYFTCRCNPPFETEREDGSFYAHRIPIDCMTAEDWKQVAQARQERAKTVYVVSVEGDVDCNYDNDGATSVHVNKPDAWAEAHKLAQAFISGREWDTDPSYKVDDEGIHLERGDYLVKEMTVQ